MKQNVNMIEASTKGGFYINKRAFGTRKLTKEEVKKLVTTHMLEHVALTKEDIANRFTKGTYKDGTCGKYSESNSNLSWFENVDAMVNMNVQYTQLTLQERLAYMSMDDEALVDMILGDRDSMAATYAQAGIENAVLEKTTVHFLGQDCCAIRTSATVQGYPYYMLQVFEYGLGRYGVTITFASFFEDNTASMLDLFYVLD